MVTAVCVNWSVTVSPLKTITRLFVFSDASSENRTVTDSDAEVKVPFVGLKFTVGSASYVCARSRAARAGASGTHTDRKAIARCEEKRSRDLEATLVVCKKKGDPGSVGIQHGESRGARLPTPRSRGAWSNARVPRREMDNGKPTGPTTMQPVLKATCISPQNR